jgi:hypothetical protein
MMYQYTPHQVDLLQTAINAMTLGEQLSAEKEVLQEDMDELCDQNSQLAEAQEQLLGQVEDYYYANLELCNQNSQLAEENAQFLEQLQEFHHANMELCNRNVQLTQANSQIRTFATSMADENARLKKELEYVHLKNKNEMLEAENARLKKENEKIRADKAAAGQPAHINVTSPSHCDINVRTTIAK